MDRRALDGDPGCAVGRVHDGQPAAPRRGGICRDPDRAARRPRFSGRGPGRRRLRRDCRHAAAWPGPAAIGGGRSAHGVAGHRADPPPGLHRPRRGHFRQRGQDLDQESAGPAAGRRSRRRARHRGQPEQPPRRAAHAHPARSRSAQLRRNRGGDQRPRRNVAARGHDRAGCRHQHPRGGGPHRGARRPRGRGAREGHPPGGGARGGRGDFSPVERGIPGLPRPRRTPDDHRARRGHPTRVAAVGPHLFHRHPPG